MGLKSNQVDQTLRSLAESVGDFIRYWGFRRIHGQIWTLLFLTKESLSGADLVRRLKVSKALVSPALKELEAHGLIVLDANNSDEKTQRYLASPKVMDVIQRILKTREAVLIRQAAEKQQLLVDLLNLEEGPQDEKARPLQGDRLQVLGEMIQAASVAVDFLIEME